MPSKSSEKEFSARRCVILIGDDDADNRPPEVEEESRKLPPVYNWTRSLIVLALLICGCFFIHTICRLLLNIQVADYYYASESRQRIAQVENLWSLISVSSYLAATRKSPSRTLPVLGTDADDREEPNPRRTNRLTASNATRQLPQGIIIGVKKGGTRALLEYMRMHPNIRAPGNEMHFFDRHYERGIDWYRNQMPETVEGQITIEKTPSYFVTREAPRRIHEMNAKMKLIIVVRDPITRAISDYTQARSKGRSTRSFQEMAFYSNGTHRLPDSSWGALRIGLYALHLTKWLKYFPLEQMLFINGEDLIHNPLASVERVQQFLGLEKVIRADNFYFDPAKGFPCLRRPETQLRPRCLGKSKGRRHPRVPRDVIAQLRDFYQPFNEKFYRVVGQHFDWS